MRSVWSLTSLKLRPPTGMPIFDQPVIEVPAELDIAGLGSQGLRLKPKQDQAGARAVWNANRFRLPVVAAPHAWFNDERTRSPSICQPCH